MRALGSNIGMHIFVSLFLHFGHEVGNFGNFLNVWPQYAQ
jgi:hypothetical protein